jgi:hypothetical protein
MYKASATFAMRGTIFEDKRGRVIIKAKHLATTKRKTGAFAAINSRFGTSTP